MAWPVAVRRNAARSAAASRSSGASVGSVAAHARERVLDIGRGPQDHLHQRPDRQVLVQQHAQAVGLGLIGARERAAEEAEGDALVIEQEHPLGGRVGEHRKELARAIGAQPAQAAHRRALPRHRRQACRRTAKRGRRTGSHGPGGAGSGRGPGDRGRGARAPARTPAPGAAPPSPGGRRRRRAGRQLPAASRWAHARRAVRSGLPLGQHGQGGGDHVVDDGGRGESPRPAAMPVTKP